MSAPNLIENAEGLRTIYAQPARQVMEKAFPRLDRHSRRFLELSPFFCIGSTRPDGMGDVSPRGGEAGFVHALSDTELAFPDRPGNNRLDTLGNIVREPGVGMVFFIPGVEEVLRLNGLARVTTREDLMAHFTHEKKPPRSVVLVEIREVYFHCSKALKRSDLWNPDKRLPKGAFPTLGQIAKDQFALPIPAKMIDFALEQDAKKNHY